MKTILTELIYNDLTNLRDAEGYLYNKNAEALKTIKKGTVFYCHPLLSFGDYDNSCSIERSNVRVFLAEFKNDPNVMHKRWAYDGESIFIDILCDNEDIINSLAALENYPCLDETDVSAMEIEMEEENWENWIKINFLNAIEKHYKADCSDADEEQLYNLYYKLKEASNTYFEVEAGGTGYVDIKKLVNFLPKQAPDFLKLEFWD